MKPLTFALSILMAVIMISCSSYSSVKRPVELNCESRFNPVGIDVHKPRLSWQLNDTSRGAHQSAYQILVASDLSKLKNDQGDVWDSRKRESKQSVLVSYEGPELKSRQRYYWKVRTWDQKSEPSSWSETAWWEMGLLEPSDWQAEWIGMDLIAEDQALTKYGQWITHPEPECNKDLFIRKEFEIPEGKQARKAFLHFLSQKHAGLWMNGAQVGEADFNGNIAALQIQERLIPGQNTIAFIINNKDGEDCSIIFYMEIIYSDGTTQWISSGSDCGVSKNAQAGWNQIDFDDSGWDNAVPLAAYGRGDHGWIENAGPAPRSTMLRKEFIASKKVSKARAYVSGLGNYKLWVNGSKISEDLLTPGWTDYYKRVQYQVYDLTEYISKGENAAGIVLGNMWWSSGLGLNGGTRYSSGPVRGLCQIEIEYSDGSTEQIVTNQSWSTHLSPVVDNTIYHGEVYDARLEIDGWASPGLDEADWEPATVFTQEKDLTLSSQFAPPIRIMNEIEPVSVSEIKPGKFVFDMGKNIVGYARLTVSGERGTEVKLRFAELLHDDGTVAQENLRSAKATDFYILKGEGRETWEPIFTYHGFRYVQVEGYPGTPTTSNLTGIQIYSSAEQTGYFKCSNDLINSIYKNILNGQKGNMHSVPTDCPQRDERLGWTGDAQMFAPTANYNMNMSGFFGKWMRDLTDSQSEEGYIHDVNPAIVVGGPGKPAWADAVTVVPWMVYKFYGDKKIIEDNYEGMKAFVEYMIRNSKDGLYIFDQNGWAGYGDWISVVPSPGQPISAAYYYYSTKLLSEMAGVIGKEEDAKIYAENAAKIAQTFNDKYLDRKTNNYPSATQTANLLPLAFGISPENIRQDVADNIAADVIERGKHPSTGFLGTGYILPILSEFGYHELAYEVASQTSYPSWGYMVENGATSMWELWNSDTEPPDQMNSRNHFALGSVGEWFYAYLAGIRPSIADPGFKHSIIKPMPAGDLTWASAKLYTAYGPLACGWELSVDGLSMQVTVPANTRATIHIPLEGDTDPVLSESGILIWSGEKAGSDIPYALELIEVTENEIILNALAGTYHFTVE